MLVASLISFSSVLADDLSDCRKINEDQKRLVCYDQIGNDSEQLISPAKSSNQQIALKETNPKSTHTAPITESHTNTTKKKVVEENFGLEKVISPDTIDSTILGEFTGWEKNTLFKLANGQTWKVNSSSIRPVYRRSTQNPKVRISRGFLNSYKMKVEGVNSSVKVKRVK